MSTPLSARKRRQVSPDLYSTRNTCTQQPLARLPNLFSVMLRLHTAINRATAINGSHMEIRTVLNSVIF